MLDYRLTDDDKERVRLLTLVSKKGFKMLSLQDLQKLQSLVEQKDYSHNKKAQKSQKKLLAQINAEIYKITEGREGI